MGGGRCSSPSAVGGLGEARANLRRLGHFKKAKHRGDQEEREAECSRKFVGRKKKRWQQLLLTWNTTGDQAETHCSLYDVS